MVQKVDNPPSTLALNQPCDMAVELLLEQFKRTGLSVIRTFDLQVARNTQITCSCPHHGTELCDCQMVVLLVYAEEGEPVTLIAHGYDRRTVFSVVDTPQQHANPRVEATIRLCFPQLAELHL